MFNVLIDSSVYPLSLIHHLQTGRPYGVHRFCINYFLQTYRTNCAFIGFQIFDFSFFYHRVTQSMAQSTTERRNELTEVFSLSLLTIPHFINFPFHQFLTPHSSFLKLSLISYPLSNLLLATCYLLLATIHQFIILSEAFANIVKSDLK